MNDPCVVLPGIARNISWSSWYGCRAVFDVSSINSVDPRTSSYYLTPISNQPPDAAQTTVNNHLSSISWLPSFKLPSSKLSSSTLAPSFRLPPSDSLMAGFFWLLSSWLLSSWLLSSRSSPPGPSALGACAPASGLFSRRAVSAPRALSKRNSQMTRLSDTLVSQRKNTLARR